MVELKLLEEEMDGLLGDQSNLSESENSELLAGDLVPSTY